MRSCLISALMITLSATTFATADADTASVGFPPDAFALTWTSLPTGHFGPAAPSDAPVKVHRGHALPLADTMANRWLGEAFASAADTRTRRAIALNEMTTGWSQEQRTAFQRLREAEATYADGDERHARRFAALLTRVVDGTGRSAAIDGSATTAALEASLAATLSHEDALARTRTEAAQTAFTAYRDAFAAFADGMSLGTGMDVTAELDRARAADLSADRH